MFNWTISAADYTNADGEEKKKQQQSSMMWPTSHSAKPSDGVLHNSDFVREKKRIIKFMGPWLEKLLMCCVVFRGFPHCRYLIITHKVLLKVFIKKKRNEIKIRTRKRRRSVPFFLVAVCLSIFFIFYFNNFLWREMNWICTPSVGNLCENGWK